MQDKMECDWFKPSKHEVCFRHLKQNARNAQLNAFKMKKKVSNTDINKLKWIFNHV